MTSMLDTIVPKSDQLNADDLIGDQTKTIKITKVSILAGEQPVALNYEGDQGKPYKPGKSMRRVIVNIWGSDANVYVGRRMTLYRDEKVKFGGEIVGGIRISHLSHIKDPVTMALTATRASRKPFTVKPLEVSLGNDGITVGELDQWIGDIEKTTTLEHLKLKHDAAVRVFKDDESRKQIIAAKEKRKIELTTTGEPNAQ